MSLYQSPKAISNWLMTELLGYLNVKGLEIEDIKITPGHIVEMIKLIDDKTISGKIAKVVMKEMLDTGRDPHKIVEARRLTKIVDEVQINSILDEVFAEEARAVSDALSDSKAKNFLVGQVMKKTRGRADPVVTNRLVSSRLRAISDRAVD